MFVKIDGWEYLLAKESSNTYSLWHHVTRDDGGYGTEVKEIFVTGEYSKDSVINLYNHIAAKQDHPHRLPASCRNEEISKLTIALKNIGAIYIFKSEVNFTSLLLKFIISYLPQGGKGDWHQFR